MNQREIETFLKSNLKYLPDPGLVLKGDKQLNPDVNGFVSILLPSSKRMKLKLDKLCYFLGTGIMPGKDHKILHKNLDEEDCSLRNLVLVHSSDFRRVKEAVKNLEGGIKLQQHPVDKLAHKVTWYEGGIQRSKVIHDIVPARRFETRLKLKFSKILTSYCIFDI